MKNPSITSAISAAVFPEGEPEERRTTALQRTIAAQNVGAPVRSAHGVARREAFIAKVTQRRAVAKSKKRMQKASRRGNR